MDGARTLRLMMAPLALATALALAMAICVPAASAAPAPDTGFAQPFAGVAKWVGQAPTRATRVSQVNAPLGQRRADRIAAALRFDSTKAMTKEQYALFLSGGGDGGGGADAKKSAELIEKSVRYLTNSSATRMYRTIDGKRTRILLGSYGLIVNGQGMLESPANDSSPVRQVNWVLAPMALCRKQQPPSEWNLPPGTCGYMGRWLRRNAPATLEALYASAYTSELSYGSQSQEITEPHEILPNTAGAKTVHVGMPMAPAIWIVNFLLIYALNPAKAAHMPAYWVPIPGPVTAALLDPSNTTGQVPYSTYRHLFP